MGTRIYKRDIRGQKQVKGTGFSTTTRIILLFSIILIISSNIFAKEKIGLIYKGPTSLFSKIYYEIYKYADIETPPSTLSERMEVVVNLPEIKIDFKGNEYIDKFDNYKILIRKILKDYYPRRIYVMANDCEIVLNDGDRVKSTFINWENEVYINIYKNGNIFNVPVSMPIGESIKRVPDKWVNLKIVGYTGPATLNNIPIQLDENMEIPPAKYELITPYEKVNFDTTESENNYTLSLIKEVVEKEIKMENIYAIFELESGISILGEKRSIWIPKNGDKILDVENVDFISPYGMLDKKHGIQYHGKPIFLYEYNYTVYIITSYGEILTVGLRNIIRDMERSPASIKVKNNIIEITTFGGKMYSIDLKTGGLYYKGITSKIMYNINLNTSGVFEIKDKKVIIKNNAIKIIKIKEKTYNK
ncbi:hypothetical protein XO10_00410 [Marinitoga sp. 1135]|nr:MULTISPECIES: hypothetical protein [Marinitoga]NUU94785.1 hypothetical protein [Marinitoga sp. 1135]